MPTNGNPLNPLKRPRQDPVSCEFCRSKKLKCNRQKPCSNCSARGLACGGEVVTFAWRAPVVESEVPGDSDGLSVLARLRRLEEIVIGRSSGLKSSEEPSPQVTETKQWQTNCANPSPADSQYEDAVHGLEETGLQEAGAWLAIRTLDIQTLPTHYIALEHQKVLSGQSISRCIQLPPLGEAELLLDYYIKHVDPLQHVLYFPTITATMRKLYANLESGEPPAPSQVALLLAIFASAASICPFFPAETESSLTATDSQLASLAWTNATLEVLEYARRTAARTLEEVQTSIILGFLLFHNEGFSARARCVFASSIAIARDLSLHKIDAPNSQARQPQDHVEAEIKRRVWWHVVSTDWVLALSGGPQEGTYSVQPRHMRVNRPRNINDKDLLSEDTLFNRPMSEPTSMSYYIQRIKHADLCRQVVDVMPLSSLELATVDYNQIIQLDQQFEAFFQELPPFFKVDENSLRESAALMHQQPHLQVQRFALLMIAHTRRCKLHQPFLIRNSTDRRFDYSREMSLKSARSVIRMKHLLKLGGCGFVSVSTKHTGVVYHIFMAIIVLVMDLCFNKATSEEEDMARKAEVVSGCQMLEEAKSQSRMASEFLESLMDVLRKHKVRLNNHNLPNGAPALRNGHHPSDNRNGSHQEFTTQLPPTAIYASATQYYPDHRQQPQDYTSTMQIPTQEVPQHYLSDFDTIWQEYIEMGPNMDMPEWDNLFSDLDSRF